MTGPLEEAGVCAVQVPGAGSQRGLPAQLPGLPGGRAVPVSAGAHADDEAGLLSILRRQTGTVHGVAVCSPARGDRR